MTLLAVLAALAWDYFRPLARPSPVEWRLARYADWLLEHFNAGTERHGLLAWGAGALLPAVAVGVFGALLGQSLAVLTMAWGGVVLYYAMGFRQAMAASDEIGRALLAGDLERARAGLAAAQGDAGAMPEGEVIRLGIEEGLRASLRRLFGPLFWFLLFGAFGAALYALSRLHAERWQGEHGFSASVARVVQVLDWLPARLVAFSFAIVGNFEDALLGWRSQAGRWGEYNEGIVLAAGAGALGIQLGGDLNLPEGPLERPGLGVGEAPGREYLQGARNLVSRALLLWLAVLCLLWLGSSAG